MLSDQSLMSKVQHGQLDALGLLFERYKKVLFSFFYQMTKDKMWSEDMVQGVFYKIIKSRKQYSGQGSFKSWMFTIARNYLKDQYKRNSYRRTENVEHHANAIVNDQGTLDTIYQKEQQAVIEEALSLLDKEKRELVVLVKLNEMKYKEVADIMNMNESTVKVKVFRAIKELQNIYQSKVNPY